MASLPGPASNGTAPALPGRRAGGIRLRLRTCIAAAFTLLIVAAGALIGWHNYVQNRALVLTAADDLFRAIARETVAEFESTYQPVEMLTDLLAQQRLGYATSLGERLASVSFLATALEHARSLSALYAGYPNGDFFLLRPLRNNAAIRAQFDAPAAAAYVVQSVEHSAHREPRGTLVFFDARLAEITRRDAPAAAYDPRTRDWYKRALAADVQVKTAPYVFFTTREVGLTFARRSDVGAAVVGADLTLADLSRVLARQRLTPSSELVLFNADGVALASARPERLTLDAKDGGAPRLARLTELGSPALAALLPATGTATPAGAIALRVDDRDWKAAIAPLPVAGEARGAYLAMLTPEDELLAEARRISRETLLLTLGIVLLSIPIAWLLSRLVASPLQRLVVDARAVRRFDFAPATTRSAVKEIDELVGTLDSMKVTIRNFLDIAATISAERDFDRLLERVLEETLQTAGADAGVIYLYDDDRHALRPATARAAGGIVTAPVISDTAALAEHPVCRAVATAATVVMRLPTDTPALTRLFGPLGAALGDEPQIAIALPLRNREHDIIGALCLCTKASTGEPSPELLSFVEALSGTAAVAIENQALLRARKALLDAFIRLVAGAIDAKSPYTGGHCQRVPELTRLLATAACSAQAGPFRDFAMTGDEWEALHIAAWLHDCGKVTTPEYVVDKATKLETIHDRLHEVRMRFEVLKRDAEIVYWQAVAAGGDRTTLRDALTAQWAALDADFAFVAACNEGGEFMDPAKLERIRTIAQRTWQRTLDDRIGLSTEEQRNAARTPAAPLPAIEQVLADKPEHVIERADDEALPPDNRWGFRLDVPRHRQNKGEIYNLCIGRGTLTAEERYRINHHIVQTIMMLAELPFPRHLKNVPEIAGGHHEKMDGTGYPKRLTRDEMSIPARMMAIADIFEALTASDRPYKKGKPLSEAIRIMAAMSADRHIDPQLFELFLTSGVYLEYARRFLAPAQIDAVDVGAYLAPAR